VEWDLTRPLEGSCKLELLQFEDPKANEAFWHSSAHLLGAALELLYGGHLCVGPPLETGFYYDIFVGKAKLNESNFKEIDETIAQLVKKSEKFERLVMTKEEALEVFAENPFKVQLISTKIPDGALTSAYRSGGLIDLCRGPHVPNTGCIKQMMCTKNSSAYWLGKAEYDSLQRIYGVSFPDEKSMKAYKKMLEEAAERDHRTIGTRQELYFFHAQVSPGSCFWMPMGARIYNTLCAFIRREYTIRGFQEVISPNIYADHLFKISGHYQNYKDNMYGFDVEGQDWFLKPMNCPGHCMIFDQRVRSYKELPYRMASFGVLHRNELSGTLSGLTRVRRFQQDDAHIFCRPEQIKAEVKAALDFLYYVYDVFQYTFTICLSTRPKKAIGEKSVWDKAEAALKEALNESGKPWSLNPGDGAFYGPKIDIRLQDAMRRHTKALACA
jgi:threonyl-tRNA synthetase